MGVDHASTRADGHATEQESPPSILIVSEVRLFGEGLAAALKRDRYATVSGYCSDAEEVLACLTRVRPDIVLLDAALPSGFELVGTIPKLAPQIRVVVLALVETPESVISWAEAGIAGYIPRTAGLADVGSILTGIMQGEQVCSRAVAAGLIRRLRAVPANDPADARPQPLLTFRETQIIELIGAGLSNKDIARRLNIGVATTKSHVHNLLGKLNVPRRSQAALWVRGNRNLSA
jgi:two-component system, NarL family, nitrate/nitrite response regulator NarL